MTAGSLPDTGKNGKGFVIPITQPPIVEIDTQATAAYIRLRDTKVVATKPYGSEEGLVMLDFDADENVVGIEIVGRQEFSIRELIKQIPVKTNDAVLNPPWSPCPPLDELTYPLPLISASRLDPSMSLASLRLHSPQ